VVLERAPGRSGELVLRRHGEHLEIIVGGTFLISTENLTSSVALIEAASAGLPLVGSDLGGIPEVIEHGVNGFLFKPGSPLELASALDRLIKDPGLRERMGKRSLAIYRNRFSREVMIGRIEQMYDEIVQGRADAVEAR